MTEALGFDVDRLFSPGKFYGLFTEEWIVKAMPTISS